ncbi:MAG: NADH-quinone oxidoreductase subunit N [Prevotella sp.]|nr:NADH-quinone oxidoreductase subunit N [Bacteroidales bacterium]MCI6723843.1 NADH-quinone oxidoreductase subunit N [Bacteroidales bacterium]MDD7659586.1 NADH-quinone oxidoreductase subunit N [Bacteroidales bacterium]MDY3674142.1 NADH-quinone oxidoreductase subunit N [Prevotella sp.]
MNYIQFIQMIPEAILVAVLVITFIADFASHGKKCRDWFNPLVSVMLIASAAATLFSCQETYELFGGAYIATPANTMMKAILCAGTFIVVLQSKRWLSNNDTRRIEGEFYMLTISTLLGMYVMMSAGSFLMFFLGLETASVPLACMVALDKMRKDSAEAAAKFILTATFSSGVMLYGMSLLYGAVGTLYFTEFSLLLSVTPMTICGMVFFVAGLGFKISLVPFHFWTADTYQGAPTTVTGYLSVISKGAAAFTLAVILTKVFQPMTEYWEVMMYILIVLSITVANLMAIRQSELKRFMAFSSISQAGYIMLAVIGADYAATISSLMYYVLVYIVANMSVFAIISVVEQNNGGRTDMDAYNGFYQTNPKLSFLMTLALFSLGGIPPFAGMFSKFFVFLASVNGQDGNWWPYFIMFIALVNTVVSLYYYLLIVKAMYINKTDNPLPTFKSDCNTRLTLAICTAGILLFGIASCIYEAIHAAAAA